MAHANVRGCAAVDANAVWRVWVHAGSEIGSYELRPNTVLKTVLSSAVGSTV